ncbi:MAG: Eco57I restriction-modification methylase domain-containing protein, partial [Fimbriiglobus sp.]
LNSPVMWWHNWRHLVHLKDEALSPMGYLVETMPIPRPTDAARSEVEALVARLIDLQSDRTAGIRAVLDWLRTVFDIDKPTQKLAAMVELSADDFIAEVRKIRGKKAPLSVLDVKQLKDEHARSVLPLRATARESLGLERRVSDLVNAAYGLTPADVALMWQTAPPRMPIPSPLAPRKGG